MSDWTGEQVEVVVLPADGPPPLTAELLGTEHTPEADTQQSSEPDRLVPPSGSGLPGWSARTLAALRACWRPALAVTAVCAGMPHLFTGRISDTVVVAPLLQDLAGGAGLLLLPFIWLVVLAVRSLMMTLCLAAVIALVVGWGADGRPPGGRALVRLAAHRVRPLWGWLAAVYAVEQMVTFAVSSLGMSGFVDGPVAATARYGTLIAVVGAALSIAAALFVGVLGPVLLFERGRGPRRALHLLLHGHRPAVFALAGTSAAVVLLPFAARAVAALVADDRPAGGVAALVTTVVCTLVWVVAAAVAYAQLRDAERPATSVGMREALAVEEA
jgi:hypothetical protein